MKHQVTKISVLQSSKIMTALYVLIGFIYTVIGLFMLIFGDDRMMGLAIAYCLMPIIMGIIGFVFFAAFATIYNWLATRLGGFEFEMTTKE